MFNGYGDQVAGLYAERGGEDVREDRHLVWSSTIRRTVAVCEP